MTPYEVLGIVAAAIIFSLTVGSPVIRLNTAVTKLISAVDALQKTVDALTRDNKAEHEKLAKKAEEHDKTIGDHETRISILEHNV